MGFVLCCSFGFFGFFVFNIGSYKTLNFFNGCPINTELSYFIFQCFANLPFWTNFCIVA